MAIPYGKMIPCSVVVSPEHRGQTVIEMQGKIAERQLVKRGWVLEREIWMAPIGWKDSATIIFPFPPMIGRIMYGYRFYDSETDANVTVVTNGRSPLDEQKAMKAVRKMGWRLFRHQWRSPR